MYRMIPTPILLIDNQSTKHTETQLTLRKLKKYFPIFKDEDISKCQMSKRSIYSTALLFDGKKTAEIVYNLLTTLLPTTSHYDILDACSNVGGNALWFAHTFKENGHITSVEIDKNEYNRLHHNLTQIYRFSNVSVYCNNVLHILSESNKRWNTIFFDPPWGGRSYKKIEQLIIGLDGFNICDIIDWCFEYKKADTIVLRHPNNIVLHTVYKKIKTVNFMRTNGKQFYQLSVWIHPSVEYSNPESILPSEIYIPQSL